MTGIEIAMAAVTAVTSVVGGMVQASGARAQGKAASQAATYNAEVSRRNAGIARNQAAEATADKALENRRQMATIHAAYGASGLDLTGSPLDVLSDSATEGALSQERERYKGELKALELKDKASQFDAEAFNDKKAGSLSAVGYMLGGVGGAASAIGKGASAMGNAGGTSMWGS